MILDNACTNMISESVSTLNGKVITLSILRWSRSMA
jgi:hypothetical protein